MLLLSDLFYRFVARLRRTTHEVPNESFLDPNQTHTRSQRPSNRDRHGYSMFERAHDFDINQPTFFEQNIHLFAGGKLVLDRIHPHTDPDAAVDSSARFPPPLCHPGTRLKIREKLFGWLTNLERHWNMMWLNGPAATGKSAVAQTFAECCLEDGRLGAAFFFSRPNKRNDPNTVIPTLIYQLAVGLPAYKSLITARLTDDPQLMRKARHIQFKRLIIEPFSQLQSQEQTRITEPLLIVLDGLDECKEERAQRDIIDMISEASRLKEGLPLLWLIVSRPEAYLKHIFSQPDYTVNCGREELAIDAESIADVNLYIRDGLAGIKHHFPYATSESWPQEEQVTKLLKKASGHFGFASTALRYIGDEMYATPMAQLDDLLCFVGGITTGTGRSNPLAALDALYAGILRDVPNNILCITKWILGFHIVISYIRGEVQSVQFVCNFWKVDQATFYSAFRKLHSVVDIPTPEEASSAPLRFYHASFQDYLLNPRRSDSFIIMRDMFREFAKLCLSWLKTDAELFHTNDNRLEPIRWHNHGTLPDLKWVSDGNRAHVSSSVAKQAWNCFLAATGLATWDGDLLSQIHNFDFRHTQSFPAGSGRLNNFINKLWEEDSTSGIIRTVSQSEGDFRLLKYMKSMIRFRARLEPATLPLSETVLGRRTSRYFLVGHGSNAIACWQSKKIYDIDTIWHSKERYDTDTMACGLVPSKEGLEVYKAWVIGGNDW